jgi:DNA-directed RNA polymerase specialized sigma24 family protein
VGDITQLFDPALRGDRTAQGELFRLTEPELRKLALHWLRRYGAGDRVRATELIDEAFLRLIPPPFLSSPEGPGQELAQAGAPANDPRWRHRGAFYAYVSRNMLQALIDLFRRQGGPRDPTALREVLTDALGGPGVDEALRATGGEPADIRRVLGDVAGREQTVRRILQLGEDPSAVQRAFADLLQGKAVGEQLRAAGPDPEALRRVLTDLLRTEAAARKLARGRAEPAGGQEPEAAPAHGLTQNSFATLQEALGKLDQAFPPAKLAPDAPVATLLGHPPVSLHRAIVELRFFAGCTLEEIAGFTDLPTSTVHAKLRVALAFLREELQSSFPEFGRLADEAAA